MIRHAGPTVKLLWNRLLPAGRLDVSTSDPMAAFGADVVGRGDLDLSIGAPRTPKRAELPGHPHRTSWGSGSLRTSVRFVRGDLPLHLPAASRAAAAPAEHGADAGPQLDERSGLSGKATACVHFCASIGDRRDPDNRRKPPLDLNGESIRLQARSRRPHRPSSDAVAARFANVVHRGDPDPQGRMRRPIHVALPPTQADHPRRPALLADVRLIRCEPPNHPPAASWTAAPPTEHGADHGPQLDERPRLPLELTGLRHDETSVGNPHWKDHTGCLKETSTSPIALVEPGERLENCPRRFKMTHNSSRKRPTSWSGL